MIYSRNVVEIFALSSLRLFAEFRLNSNKVVDNLKYLCNKTSSYPSLLPYLFLSLYFLPTNVYALPYYGANFSAVLLSRVPSPLNGYQIMINYDPQRFMWKNFNLYFDGGFSHFHSPHAHHHSTINAYAVAPVLRYSLMKYGLLSPYFEISFGLSYLNQTRIKKRNLGMHFAFQDRLGIGALWGESKQFSIGLHVVHYSNARLASHNSGMTVPVMLDIGYRFQ